MLNRRIESYFDLVRYHRRRSSTFAEHDYRDVYLATRQRLETVLGHKTRGLRILDVGCGQRFPATLLFAADGNHVTGVDTELVVKGPGPVGFARIWRANGLERAIKTLVRQVLFDPAYYRTLEDLAREPLHKKQVDLRRFSITEQLPLATDSYDVVISNAVFEHIPDLPAAIRTISRVLKPGGLFHIGIHLFPSLSGGHHMAWAFPEASPPDNVPPWDHLRENLFPAHVFLNKLRERDYRKAFESDTTVEVLEWITTRTEGEKFLSSEIQLELKGRFQREELLKREIVVLGRCRV